MAVDRTAVLVTSFPGQPRCDAMVREAARGERPRKDYAELARLMRADVFDWHFMAERASPLARLIGQRCGPAAGQVAEAWLAGRRYRHVCAWADRLGLPLAALNKLTGARRDLVLVSQWLSRGRKRVFLRRLRADSHIRAIVCRRQQAEIALREFRLFPAKIYTERQAVDDRFWRPESTSAEDAVCAVGWEARDYVTLIEAMHGMPLRLDLTTASIALPSSEGGPVTLPESLRPFAHRGLPENVRLGRFTWTDLRQLYARSRFVVVPVRAVEYDAGVTSLAEAMSMGKAVIATRTRGLDGFFEDGVHGIFVPPYDVGALRRAIEYLTDRPDEAERMGRAGRALIEQRHTFDAWLRWFVMLIRNEVPAAVAGKDYPAAAPGS